MELIRKLLGLGGTVERIAEVFIPNKTAAQAQAHLQKLGAQSQFAAEFQHARTGYFDRFIDGLNRLPRPTMALGTVGLFGYAMQNPTGFTIRMQGLAQVPEPLWWLLGAVVSFYFGARELHHFRKPTVVKPLPKMGFAQTLGSANQATTDNAALDDWFRTQE